MKKNLSFLCAVFAFIMGSAQADSCAYSIVMHDAWGDGWNSGEVLIVLDGDSTAYEPANAGGGNVSSSDTAFFTVNELSLIHISEPTRRS